MPAVSVSFCCLTRYRSLSPRSLSLAGRWRCSGLRVADASELAGMPAVSQPEAAGRQVSASKLVASSFLQVHLTRSGSWVTAVVGPT